MTLPLRRLFVGESGRLLRLWRIVLFLAGVAVVLAVLTLAAPPSGMVSAAGVLFFILGAGGVCGVAMLLTRFVDRAPSATLGLSLHSRVAIEVGQGLGVGVAIMTFVVAVDWSAGWLEIGAPSASIGERLAMVALALLALLPAAALEELLFRGYALQQAIAWLGVVPAVLLSSFLFGVAHNANPGADWLSLGNTILAGILLALAYLRTRSLWLPILLHYSWNACQGPIYGLPVSGLKLDATLLVWRLTDAGRRLDWLTGGTYGPEGGLVLTIAVVTFLVIVARRSRVRPALGAPALWEPRR
jgi:hypothetical protein